MDTKSILSMEIGKGKIADDEIVLMCSQYATILRSGAQAATCTRLIATQASNKKLKEILEGVSKDIESGKMLSDSFERRGAKAFPQTFYETIRTGERSGRLAESFETLKEYFKKQSSISKQVKSALIYPAFVIAVAVVVLIVVMVYVMPQLTSIFENMGGEIPGITKALIAVSDFFANNIIFIIIGIIVLVLCLKLYGSTPNGRIKIDRIKLKIPLIGKIQYLNMNAQFASTLSMLLSSGLVMTNALKTLSKIFDNVIFKNASSNLAKRVESGRGLAASMKKEECFPNTLIQMTKIGEESGELESILETTGEYYQGEAENATKSLLMKLEPTLLVFVAVLAGIIVFAIYIPLFQMYDLF